jgi:DNA helicase INO80
MGDLKEYQLKGLRWLDNLFEQGINGILADEMGLGKTIQAIAFLAHLSEDKNNWGPFLVIAPNATLYNWQQEFNRFCPSLKVLPYWGALKERKTLRKFFNSSQLYVKNSAFHVCITSYQLIVCDEKVFHKVNWNYMILDEAQAIKNIASQRWNTLLSFNCRNRLLLSGTPIQNSMSELWALLHFIMPNLFDSHEQFQDWFSKDIEAHSQDKGELNQEQLKRLHQILKPFMLRRVKKDVEHEIGPKVEYEILCYMTEKQKVLYNSIKQKLNNISDLFKSTDSKLKVTNLMNLVIQFRKVCNHPELFERNIGKVPFTFKNLIDDLGAGSIFTILNGEQYLRINEYPAINYEIPKMIYDLCYDKYKVKTYISKKLIICDDLNFENKYAKTDDIKSFNSLFNIFHLFDMSLYQLKQLFIHDEFILQLSLKYFFEKKRIINNYYKKNGFKEKVCLFIAKELFPVEDDFKIFSQKGILEPLIISTFLSRKKCILHNLIIHRCFIPKVVAFPPLLICSNRRTMINQRQIKYNLLVNKILYGLNYNQFNKSLNLKISSINREILNNENSHNLLENGLMTPLFYQMEGYTQIELPSFERLISDCAKLKKLDELLKKLIVEDHRVLIFCQMTRMLDILEEYMSKRKYTYFRMDGSTQIADRRDMINEFQTNPKIFAFLLSTRAGGLGVNLTGADTVIFYDNDWNPTMDAQATDRAHRIGQTKVVSVYRLITADTIEERVLKRAKQKQNVQATVYSGGAFKADIFKQNDIVELLYSEEEMKKMEQDKKKLLLELNNNETIRNDGDVNIFGNVNGTGNNNKNINNEMSINGNNQFISKSNNKESNKGVKKKRGPKKEKKNNNENKVRESPTGDASSQVNGNKGKRTKKNSIMGNGLSRNIFSVRNNNRNGTGSDNKNKKNNLNENVVEII